MKLNCWLVLVLVTLVSLFGCASQQPQPQDPPAVYDGPQLAFEQESNALIFGPFVSKSRGIDYFWQVDGKTLLLVAEVDEKQQLWQIDASNGSSRLLRDASGVEAILPIAWLGSDTLLSLDIQPENNAFNVTKTTWDSATATNSTVLPGSGRLLSHAVSEDGRWVTVYSSTADGGQVVRLDTENGTITRLLEDLPLWDGLFPVWFAPSGLHAITPRSGNWPLNLQLLDIVDGSLHSIVEGLEDFDLLYWSPDGSHFAYKLADGNHNICTSSDMNLVISRQVRVHTSTGELLWEVHLPNGGMIGSLHWVNHDVLLLVEYDSNCNEKAYWAATISSKGLRSATSEEADQRYESLRPYPMAKGDSQYQVEVEDSQDASRTPAQILRILR